MSNAARIAEIDAAIARLEQERADLSLREKTANGWSQADEALEPSLAGETFLSATLTDEAPRFEWSKDRHDIREAARRFSETCGADESHAEAVT